MREKEINGLSGWLMLILLVAVLILSIVMLVSAARAEAGYAVLAWIVVMAVDAACLFGLTVVNPNEAKVVQLFGVYKGSIKQQGFWWVHPLTRRRRVSLRIRNFESSKLKVNDQDGNPIEIAAVVVWRVVETAEAIFHVDD
jgi:regulator of protease activity HflC (stomatin/prohibitin superfamily)